MFDYDKIHFKEVDDTDVPLQIFFEDEMSEVEFESFVEDYIDKGQIQEGNEIVSHEFCLSMYSKEDYKLEMHVKYMDLTPDWLEVLPSFRDADRFIEAFQRANPEIEEVISEYLESLQEQSKNEVSKEAGLDAKIAGAKKQAGAMKENNEGRQDERGFCL